MPPGSAFRCITHASSTTVLVLSVPLIRCCLSLRIRDLFGLPRFPVLEFDQGPYASLLGPTRLLCFRYTSAYWFFIVFLFHQPSHVSLPGPTLRTLTFIRQCSLLSIIFGSRSSAFRPMARPLCTSSCLGCFFLIVQPMAPRQLSMSNVADSDVHFGSVPYFLPCLSVNDPTARPFGTTIQAVYLSGLHSVTRVPFFVLTLFPRLYLLLWLPSHLCAQWPRPLCFRRPVATSIP